MRRRWTCLVIALLLVLAAGPLRAEWTVVYETGFGRGQWCPDDWLAVQSPRGPRGEWFQWPDCIENLVPADFSRRRWITTSRAYASMVLARPLRLGEGVSELRVSATMEFDHNQGPQVVLAHAPGAAADGHPEYREHWEIVLFNQGINVWHHVYRDGGPAMSLVAYSRFALADNTPHRLEVTVNRMRYRPDGPAQGRWISVTVGDRTFGYHEPHLGEEFYAGIIAYGSRNRFYDFSVEQR